VNWDEMAVVGRIARAHGIRGQVILDSDTDFPHERFQPGAEVFIERGGALQALKITSVRFHRGRPIVGVEGIATMSDAETLAGRELRVPIDRLAALPQDTFYRHDLVGCEVVDRDGARIGIVSGVEGTLGGSRLVVDGGQGEILIPLAAEICTAIDVGAKRIVVDAPDGLLNLNE
jgi:16S rRNA processing protein RimM